MQMNVYRGKYQAKLSNKYVPRPYMTIAEEKIKQVRVNI